MRENSRQTDRGSGWPLTLAAFLLLAAALLWLHFYRAEVRMPPQDEGLLLVYPDLILRGLVPNRDFTTLYTPGAFWTVATAFATFGKSVAVERGVGLLFQLVIVGAVVRISRPYGFPVIILAGLAACTGIALCPPAALSVLAAIGAALWALSFGRDRLGVDTVASGACAGLAFVFRQDIGLIAVIAAAALLIDRSSRVRLAQFGLGLIFGLAPLLVHLLVVGLPSLFQNYVLDVLHNGPGRALPIKIDVTILIYLLAQVWIAGAAGFLLLKRLRRPGTLFLIALAGFSLAITPSALQRADGWHIGYAATVALPVAVILWAALLPRLRLESWWAVPAAAAAVLGWAVLLKAEGWPFELPEQPGQVQVSAGERSVLVPSERQQELQSIVALASRLPSGSTIFVGPQDLSRANMADTMLYFLLPHLEPASRHLELNPGVTNAEESTLATDLNRADFLLLTSEFDSWTEPNASRIHRSPRPNQVVNSKFCAVAEAGSYRLLRRCIGAVQNRLN